VYCVTKVGFDNCNEIPLNFFLKLLTGKEKILSRVCGDYIRRVLDWQLDLLDHTVTHNYSVYTLHSQFTIVLAESSYNYNWLTTESLQGPTGSHWPSTNSSGLFSATHRQLTRNWNCPRNSTDCRLTSELYSSWTDHKENTVSDSSTVAWRHYRNGPQRKHRLRFLYCCITSSPERTTKKTLVASIVAW
jgi:hypothetical protein